MAKASSSKQKDEPDRLDFVMDRFKASRNYAKKYYWDTWNECWRLYNNQRVMANYEGNSDGFVPETFTIIQAVKAHIVSPNLKVQFLATNPDQNGDTKVLNNLFSFAWYRDDTDEKVDAAILDYLNVGNGFIFQYVDEDGFPCNKYVPTQDVFIDPDATSMDDMRYCGYRYLTTKKDLQDEQITNSQYDSSNPKSTYKVPKYKNLGEIEPGKLDPNDKTSKALMEEMLGGSITSDKDLVECIVYFDKKSIVKIVNRSVIIEDDDTPFKRDSSVILSVDDMGNPVPVPLPEIPAFLPMAPFRNYKDGSLFYAKGEIEYIMELQERLNDTQNQKTDNLSFILNRMWTLDPAFASKIDEIQSIPGAVFTIPPGALEQVPTAPIGADADIEIQRIKDEMRRATAADELIQGGGTTGQTTATEVNAQLAQAGTRFQLKLDGLEKGGFRILADNMLKIMQIYITKETAVRAIGQDGVEWQNYNPGEFLGEFDVKVQLKATASAAAEVEKQNAMQFFLLASKFPFVNQQALFKETVGTLFNKDPEHIDGLMQPINPAVFRPPTKITIKGEATPAMVAGIVNPSLQPPAQPGQTPSLVPGSQAPGQTDIQPAGLSIGNIPGVPQA